MELLLPTHHRKNQFIITVGLLTLSACFDDNSQSICTAPTYNSDGTLEQTNIIRCYTPQEMQAAYQLTSLYDMGITGTGMKMVIIDAYANQTTEDDLTVFHEAFFPNKTLPELQSITVGDPEYNSSWESGVAVDTQWAHSIAPDAAIDLVMAQIDTSLDSITDVIIYVVDNYPAGTVVSMNVGAIESAYTTDQITAIETVLQQGVENGITFFASTGDYGSSNYEDEPTVYYPASSAYVTAIGGTLLQYGWSWDPTSNTPYLDSGDFNLDYFNYNNDPMQRLETVWNEAWAEIATGGGISTLFAIPKWQKSNEAVADSIYAQSGTGRGIPDLAWSSSLNGGVLSYYDGTWAIHADAATPQIAAFFVLVNQYLAEQGMDYIGHLNLWLYQLDADIAFNDILPIKQGTVLAGEQVNNQLFEYLDDGSVAYSNVPGYPTTAGWDMTTGFGSKG